MTLKKIKMYREITMKDYEKKFRSFELIAKRSIYV